MQPANRSFHEEADTFDLTVVLDGEKLAITLKDLMDWAIYSKEYSAKDIGGDEIDKRMGLGNIYTALSFPLPNEQGARLKHYEFGSIVKHEGSPCYKIDKEGKVAVFFEVIGKLDEKQFEYQSNLRLTKVRDMTEVEKLTQQFNISFDEVNQKNKTLQKKLTTLGQENGKLQDQFKTLSYQNLRIQDRFQNLVSTIASMEAESMPQPYNVRSCFVKDVTRIKFTGSIWLQYIFRRPIHPNESTQFKIRIIKMLEKKITVGVVDYEKQKDASYSYSSGNSMGYYAINSEKNPGGGNQGAGFKQGDIVEVGVNRSATTVNYIVNGKVEATHTHSMLGDSSRVFYPFIEMCTKDDEVEWCPVDTSHK